MNSGYHGINSIKFIQNNNNDLCLISPRIYNTRETVLYWNISNESIIYEFQYSTKLVIDFLTINLNKILHNKNNLLLFYPSCDGNIYIITLNNGKLLFKFNCNLYQGCGILSIDISPNNKYCIIGGQEPNIFCIYLIDWKIIIDKILNKKNNNNLDPLKLIYKSNHFDKCIWKIRFLTNNCIVCQLAPNETKNLLYIKFEAIPQKTF